MQPGQQQRRTNEDECPHLAARQLEVFGTVGKPLPTSSEAGASLRELMERMGHSSTRAALIYQHSSTERQRALADTVGALVIAKLGSEHDSSQPSGTEVAHGPEDEGPEDGAKAL